MIHVNIDQLGALLNAGYGWDQEDGNAASYQNNGFYYKVWKPDTSVSYGEKGLFVSTRIDRPDTPPRSDCCVLMLWFDDQGTLIQAGAYINLDTGDPADGVSFSTVTGASAEDIAEDLRKAIAAQLQQYLVDRPGRANYSNVVKRNILDVSACISLDSSRL
ncbi:hypothetical protein [Sorangium atrum]|uniref:Uncharacterized protein n=1 Tax=Sorangium atrum TaxID=2995308 RepID=A0ABT5BPV7_9BACT|nr:hypothetical protein [Sorangium aterium]MDC0676186.1 hypothetical protein [Sorangium aterium]